MVKYYYDKKPQALGTGTNRELTLKLLNHFHLADYFDAIMAASDVEQLKPVPATFLRCAALISIRPADCLIFEDALLGIQAALAAGMDVIEINQLEIKKVIAQLST
ncbi:HAD-IA family hydrolase [Utexia brackfieldae]|uniref:HAD-IA family hydrolase n=1 Tax=Utexia brackfieldae TaxID=3074108 RepID=UPI00370DABDF